MKEKKYVEKLKKILKDNPLTLGEISNELNLSKTKIKKKLNDLRKKGVNITTYKDRGKTYYYIPLREPIKEFKLKSLDIFGLTGDWHIGSRYTEEECLLDYLDTLKERGIKEIFHTGDVFEGVNVYQGQVNDLLPDSINLGGQIERYEEKIKPYLDGFEVYVISGNHDLKNYKKQGIDPVKIISEKSKNHNYLGQYYGRVRLEEGILLELTHPAGTSPYAKSYRIQTYLRNRPVDSYPNLLGVGHLHSSLFMDYQGVNAFLTGTFQGDTDFTRRRGLSPSIGGWIVEIDIDGEEIKSLKNEWIKY